MHMADALISPVVGGTMWAASAGLIGYCSKKVKDDLDDARIPLMGVVGAFIFAAQMINFTIPGTGSSGHLGGGMILAILLGPHAGFLTMASVLSMSPDILVMDEPTSGLDPRARRRLIEQLKTFDHTKIIAGHDLDLAVDICDRTIVIHQGGITADGPTRELLQDERLIEKSGLEKPLQMQNCPVCGPTSPNQAPSAEN